jgi:hypothetical protein
MNRFFVLEHIHEFEDGHEDLKVIGYYSTRAKAEAVLALVRSQPGFCDHPEGFAIYECEIDSDVIGWPEGYVTVYPGDVI